MTNTIAEVLERRGRLLFAAFALAVVAAMFAIAAAPAEARSGAYYDLPNKENADADVKIYWGAYSNHNTKAFDIVIDNRAGNQDMYVQFREIRTGYSFSWKRLSSDVDDGYRQYQRTYHTSSIPINAYQVRLCTNGVFSDSCAGSTTIYRY